MDPVHAALLALVAAAPFGHVLDTGSGRGQLSVLLLEAGLATSVLAIDRDGNALAQLACAAAGLPVRTQVTDLGTWQPDAPADTVLLIDVLYQFDTSDQLALLRRVAATAARTVIIRSSDPARGWRTELSTVLERLGRHWWPTFGSRYNALPVALLAETLAGCGFSVRSAPCAAGTPLSGVLLIGTRVGQPSPPVPHNGLLPHG